ncbi:MAG: EAL domain-containing protein [Dermatophilaceae bacterium]|nr:EAL domain-containing protein [Dermatophilaceae bacterium]
MITVAHSLGIRTIAEGVETVKQLEAFRRPGCDGVQGFLMSRPVPGSQVPAMLGLVQKPATLA